MICYSYLFLLEIYKISVSRGLQFHIYIYIMVDFFKSIVLGLKTSLIWNLFFLSFFLELQLQHMDVPRLRVKLELQLLAYTTSIATRDPSHMCNLHRSSWQCQILNPLSEARDGTHTLMDTTWVHNLLSHIRNSLGYPFYLWQSTFYYSYEYFFTYVSLLFLILRCSWMLTL